MKSYKDEYPHNWFEDFPKEPIGGTNPYQRCKHCKRSVPEINYALEGHSTDCEYRKNKEMELLSKLKPNKSTVKTVKFKPYPHEKKP